MRYIFHLRKACADGVHQFWICTRPVVVAAIHEVFWRKRLLIVSLLILMSIAKAGSAATGMSPSDCAALVDDQQRLACFDRFFGAPNSPEMAPRVPAGRENPSSQFPAVVPAGKGRSNPSAPSRVEEATSPVSSSEEPGAGEMPSASRTDPTSAAIAAMSRDQIGRYRFELTDGSVWEQLEPAESDLAVGDKVKLKSGRFGGTTLREHANRSRSMRVHRLD